MTVWGIAIFIFVSASMPAFAVKMDETTHDLIIQKLELGVNNMDKQDPERTGILIRLADLLADRARLKSMNEMDRHCTTCKGAATDRQRAIALYNEALPKAEKEKQGPIVLQIAHLHNLGDQSKKATALYKQVLAKGKKTYSAEVIAIADASLGEIHFRRGEFKTALGHFQSARREGLKNRALVEYRIAWCQLNLGQVDAAIATLTRLLENKDILATQTTDGKTADPAFVTDATRDLARFLARVPITPARISLLRRLSPDGSRKENLHELASEADRLGKKGEALVVWAAYVDEPDVKPGEKLDVQIRVARIFYDLNKHESAANAYEKAMDLWKKNGCAGAPELCQDLKATARQMAIAWNKAVKQDGPTPQLFRVYVAYTNVFAEDVEMMHWGAVVGHDLKRYRESARMFHDAAALALAGLGKNPADKNVKQILEGSMLGEIEMAEAAGDAKTREAAYNFYLQNNAKGSHAFEVRYQRAKLFYDSNRRQEAFSEFHFLATQPGKQDRDLKVKSADLALDSLAESKDDQNIQVRALEYARIFPERKTEYLKISRQASMNIVAINLKHGQEKDRSDYKSNLAAMEKVNMEGADEAERIKFYKNKLIVAQKALALDAVADAGNRLLIIPSLSQDDREWVLEQKVWAAELQLNFALAYEISSNMRLAKLSPADRQLRLALLADLAGRDARPHHEQYIKLNRDVRAGNLVRVTMIKSSNRPWRELDRHLGALKATPDLLAGVTLETFAREKDFRRAEKILSSTRIRSYPAGQTLARHIEMRDFEGFSRKIARHRISTASESAMQRSLKERLKLIGENEREVQTAIRRRDWTEQILWLSVLARENRRLYADILALPVPRKLTGADRQKYQALLRAQSAPYLGRADKIEKELEARWTETNSVQMLQSTYMTSTPELQKIYRDEIRELAGIAPSGIKNRLHDLLNTPYRRPSHKEIMFARRELQSNPFDISKAENLRELEARNGRPSMVAFLDARISQLKRGKE